MRYLVTKYAVWMLLPLAATSGCNRNDRFQLAPITPALHVEERLLEIDDSGSSGPRAFTLFEGLKLESPWLRYSSQNNDLYLELHFHNFSTTAYTLHSDSLVIRLSGKESAAELFKPYEILKISRYGGQAEVGDIGVSEDDVREWIRKSIERDSAPRKHEPRYDPDLKEIYVGAGEEVLVKVYFKSPRIHDAEFEMLLAGADEGKVQTFNFSIDFLDSYRSGGGVLRLLFHPM